jgi:phosphatidylglycerol---prolipoprotein diacylglyceryl transferase
VIPYYQPPSLHLGPFTLEPFGLFAAAGIYLGARLASGRAARQGLDPGPLADYAMWGVLGGVLGGHLVHLLLYHPEELRDPWRVVKVWDGLSSFGGLLGALVALGIFLCRRHLSLSPYGDALALGTAPGWGVARLGCFAVHDHPGVRTQFPLAVDFPGGPRHDLGLDDALLLFAIAGVLYLLASRGALRGRLLALLAVLYGVGRFLLDFLRARDLAYVDARYFGLTPAQYFCFLIVGWGIYRLAQGSQPSEEVSVAPEVTEGSVDRPQP